MTDSIIRKRIVFTGRVQGVGFRWRSRCAAERFGVTGWVRNQWNGSVLMEAQGTEAAIDHMLFSLQESRYIGIDGMQVTKLAPDPEERRFHILDDD